MAARTKRVPWPVARAPLGHRDAHPRRWQDWQGICLSHLILSRRHSAQETWCMLVVHDKKKGVI